MDPIRKRKVAAAIAAVIAHLAEAPQQAVAAAPPPEPLPPTPSPWAFAGRHDAMLLRGLWQRRVARVG